MFATRFYTAALLFLSMSANLNAAEKTTYSRWKNWHGKGNDYFPIAVWLQSPRNASKYKEIGINLFVGLWKGPTQAQIAELKKHGMPVICSQNDYALKHLGEKIIAGWMHGVINSQGYGLLPVLFVVPNKLVGGIAGIIAIVVYVALGLGEWYRASRGSRA